MRSPIWMGMLAVAVAGATWAREPAPEPAVVRLPPPQTEGGLPLMQALKARHSAREFSPRALPPQLLANLLWAASGVNRPESGKRTAPTARDWREIDIYVIGAEGVQVYVPEGHALRQVSGRDLRALTGVQDFVATAPVNLVYVANLGRMDTTPEHQRLYAATDTGFIAQNVYLFCASEGLACVVRGSIDRDALAAALDLTPDQIVILAQSVGYPAR